MNKTLRALDERLNGMLCCEQTSKTLQEKIKEAMETWEDVVITDWDDACLEAIAEQVAASGETSWVTLENIGIRVHPPRDSVDSDCDESEPPPSLWNKRTTIRVMKNDREAGLIISDCMMKLASITGGVTSSEQIHDCAYSHGHFNTMWVARDSFSKVVAVVIRTYQNVYRMNDHDVDCGHVEEAEDETIDTETLECLDTLIGIHMKVYVKRFISDKEQRAIMELLEQHGSLQQVIDRFEYL